MTDLPAPPPSADRPRARSVALDPEAGPYQRLLGGPPETVTMRSGLVTLAPGRAVGRHSTGDREEALVVLEGAGRLTVAGGEGIELLPGCLAYCPPDSEHDVLNVGEAPLRYVYVTAKVPRALIGHDVAP
ncbi:MAG: cupin domain-containing protein [Candidatus Krumholzibacteriia bacterium]